MNRHPLHPWVTGKRKNEWFRDYNLSTQTDTPDDLLSPLRDAGDPLPSECLDNFSIPVDTNPAGCDM